ncbi:MAG: hypothetical protein D3905_15115, partial [Candidatus Electrothrix sp. AS4_5]|nr:hypothetical protein [Candidatus Electrothrix gigas]
MKQIYFTLFFIFTLVGCTKSPLDMENISNIHSAKLHTSAESILVISDEQQEQFYSLTFADLFYPWVLETRLDLIKKFYKNYTDVDLGDLKD